MNAYKIQSGYNYSQTHIVIADDMAEAEKVYLKEYEYVTIKEIELLSEYVLIQSRKGK